MGDKNRGFRFVINDTRATTAPCVCRYCGSMVEVCCPRFDIVRNVGRINEEVVGCRGVPINNMPRVGRLCEMFGGKHRVWQPSSVLRDRRRHRYTGVWRCAVEASTDDLNKGIVGTDDLNKGIVGTSDLNKGSVGTDDLNKGIVGSHRSPYTVLLQIGFKYGRGLRPQPQPCREVSQSGVACGPRGQQRRLTPSSSPPATPHCHTVTLSRCDSLQSLLKMSTVPIESSIHLCPTDN